MSLRTITQRPSTCRRPIAATFQVSRFLTFTVCKGEIEVSNITIKNNKQVIIKDNCFMARKLLGF